MPPTASEALGDGCTRTAGSMHGSDTHTLARIAQIRGGACPAPASMMPLAGSCCEHPMTRAVQQLAALSSLKTRRAALISTSWAPHPAALHRLARHLCSPIGSAPCAMMISSDRAAPTRQAGRPASRLGVEATAPAIGARFGPLAATPAKRVRLQGSERGRTGGL